jgi:hypothetical protein
MNREEIQAGDQVILVSPYEPKRGPFTVRRVYPNGFVSVEKPGGRGRQLKFRRSSEVVKLKPGQTVKQALTAAVPANQRCQICGYRPGAESHFITVPVPKAFFRICIEDRETIKREVRKRVEEIVNKVFEEAKRKAER